MPKYCSVYGCFNSSDNNSDLSFHDFPSHKKTRDAWVKRIRRDDFVPTTSSYVCAKHFNESDFSKPNLDTPPHLRRKGLKRGTIPSLNLRGTNEDEKIEKRQSFTSSKARKVEVAVQEASSSTIDEDVVVESFEKMDTMKTNDNDLQPVIFDLKEKLFISQGRIKELERSVVILEGNKFCYANLSCEDILAYTNIGKVSFDALCQYLKRFQPYTYWHKTVNSLSHEDQLLICLMKLKLDLPLFDIARRYLVSRTTVQNIFMTYIHILHKTLFKAVLNKIPSLAKNQSCLPESFGNFSNCRVILDCTEFMIEKTRSNLNAASLLYSNYKHNLSAKYLIAVAPNGTITFVSNGYLGSVSDKMVTDDSGILHQMQAGDLILADKGFLLHDLIPKDVFLNLPAFLRGKDKFTRAEAIFSREIARSRIHVERAIERLRNYRILDKISARQRSYCDVIVQVCSALVNLQSPIIGHIFEGEREKDIDFLVTV